MKIIIQNLEDSRLPWWSMKILTPPENVDASIIVLILMNILGYPQNFNRMQLHQNVDHAKKGSLPLETNLATSSLSLRKISAKES
jgi:hypothetical protein